MALIKCYECSKEISDKAISCPNCGAPQSEKQQKINKESKSDDKPTKSNSIKLPNLSNIRSILSECFKELKKTILYALGLSILISGLLSYINYKELEMVDFIGGSIFLFICYIGLFSAYFLFKKYIKEDNPLCVIVDYIYKLLVNRSSLKSQIDNKKEFTDLTTNRFENLVFFLLLWSILHLILILTGCFEGYAYYNSYYDEFRIPQYDNPKMFGESLFYIILVFLPYWIIKLLTSIVISIKNKSFMWPNNIMLKFISIATAIIFCIIYLPLLQDSAQKTKERVRMMSKQSEQKFKTRADDMLKEQLKNNPVFQENIDRILEENKFELQEK